MSGRVPHIARPLLLHAQVRVQIQTPFAPVLGRFLGQPMEYCHSAQPITGHVPVRRVDVHLVRLRVEPAPKLCDFRSPLVERYRATLSIPFASLSILEQWVSGTLGLPVIAAPHMGDAWEFVPPVNEEGEVVPVLRLVVALPFELELLLQLLQIRTFLLGQRRLSFRRLWLIGGVGLRGWGL